MERNLDVVCRFANRWNSDTHADEFVRLSANECQVFAALFRRAKEGNGVDVVLRFFVLGQPASPSSLAPADAGIGLVIADGGAVDRCDRHQPVVNGAWSVVGRAHQPALSCFGLHGPRFAFAPHFAVHSPFMSGQHNGDSARSMRTETGRQGPSMIGFRGRACLGGSSSVLAGAGGAGRGGRTGGPGIGCAE